jgi:hypothetical protein
MQLKDSGRKESSFLNMQKTCSGACVGNVNHRSLILLIVAQKDRGYLAPPHSLHVWSLCPNSLLEPFVM